MPLNPHWDAVQKMIGGFLELYPEFADGVAHVVLSDYNLEDHWIEDAQEELGAIYMSRSVESIEHLQRLQALEYFLKFLLNIPEEKRIPTREE